MAKTFIGQLILRLQAQGLSEADKVKRAMDGIERRAKALSQSAWGAGFERQMGKLGLSAQQIDAVKKSWINLHKSMDERGLDKALRKSEISAWKVATLGHFTAVRDSANSTRRAVNNLRESLVRMGLVTLGGYTGAYMGGVAIREGLTAASEYTRAQYRMDVANVPGDEQEKMRAEAARLSGKYGSIDEASILELNKATWALFGGDGGKARALMESLVKQFVTDVTMSGVETAGNNLTTILKAMDVLNVNQGETPVEDIKAILEGWARAKQIEGKDIDLAAFLGFARAAKVSKYGLSDDFLTNYLPALGQDVGIEQLGTALSGAYQNLVTPSSGGSQGQYVKRQVAMGLRDANNSLIQRDLFASNPYEWTLKVLKPLLEQKGVDTGNTAAVSEAIKKLMSNSNAAALLTGWIEAQAQIDKNVALYKGAAGTSGAEDARQRDPFAAWESVLVSLRNLSAAVLPMETIAAGLNGLADAINGFKEKVRNADPTVVGMGVSAATLAAGWTTWKLGTMVWGLITAGTNLNAAAVALQAAALSLGGAGAAESLADVKNSGGKGGWAAALLWWKSLGVAAAPGLAAGALASSPGDDFEQQVAHQRVARKKLRWWLLGDAGERTKDDFVGEPTFSPTSVVGAGRISGETGGGAVGAGKPLISLSDLFDNWFSDEISKFEGRDELPGSDRGSGHFDTAEQLRALIAKIESPLPDNREHFDTAAELRAIIDRLGAEGRLPENKTAFSNSDELRALIARIGPERLPENKTAIDETAIAAAEQRAAEAGRSIEASLNVTAKPNVDSSMVDVLNKKLREAIALMHQFSSSLSAADNAVDRQLRRSMADYGVSP